MRRSWSGLTFMVAQSELRRSEVREGALDSVGGLSSGRLYWPLYGHGRCAACAQWHTRRRFLPRITFCRGIRRITRDLRSFDLLRPWPVPGGAVGIAPLEPMAGSDRDQ